MTYMLKHILKIILVHVIPKLLQKKRSYLPF